MIDGRRGSGTGKARPVTHLREAIVPVGGNAAARAGLSADAQRAPPDHQGLAPLAYLYDDERDYLSYLAAFAGTGLRNAEPVFVAVPGHRAALLRDRLGAESPLVRYGAMTETGRNP